MIPSACILKEIQGFQGFAGSAPMFCEVFDVKVLYMSSILVHLVEAAFKADPR